MVIEELQYSSHIDMFIRPDNRTFFERATFVFNVYYYPEVADSKLRLTELVCTRWRPLYLAYINDIKQIGYTDSKWYQSDEVINTQEKRANKCEDGDCYCRPFTCHSFKIVQHYVYRYFEQVIDLGNLIK